MKISRVIAAAVLLASGVASARAAEAARGTYQFTLGDRLVKYTDFDAQKQPDGSTAGQMFFSDESTIREQDVDGDGNPVNTYQGFYIRATLDGLVVKVNQAVMSGTVTDSSVKDWIGQRVLLTVEDNGQDPRLPDKLTWGIYKPAGSWETSDAERNPDPGVGMTWETSDAERRDDVPIHMPPDMSIGTQTFPFSAYVFVDTNDGAGDIVVQS